MLGDLRYGNPPRLAVAKIMLLDKKPAGPYVTVASSYILIGSPAYIHHKIPCKFLDEFSLSGTS